MNAKIFLLPAALLSGCVGLYGPNSADLSRLGPVDDPQRNAAIAGGTGGFEKDRRAILAMLGEYAVRFGFQETVALKSGYEKRQDQTTGAFETVLLLEDSGKAISLQHLLVSAKGGHVIKHWRQDWRYEAPARWEFTSDQTWRIRPLPAARTQGAWTQCVYEVSDAPRYCGTGKWNHQYGAPTWTSDRGWRPLPRREYTKREDYNALNAENRHTITPSGWTHEQDNTKAVRDGESTRETLVREFGFNDYRRIGGFDFKPAYDYWAKTKDYWAEVRQQWTQRIVAHDGIALKTPVDGMKIITPLFAQAERVKKGETVPQAEILAVFEQWTAAPGAQGAAQAPPARTKAAY